MFEKANRVLIALAIATSGALFAGCGGEVNETHTGTLEAGDDIQPTDSSFQDPYTFSTKEGYQIDIQMTSTAVDSYLILSDPQGNKVGENDDAAEGSNDARISLVAPSSGTYTVLANTYQAGETGAYTLTINCTKAE